MNDRSGLFAEDGQILLTVGKMFGKFKTIISLDTLYLNPPAGIPSYQLFQKICTSIGGLLRIVVQKL